MESENKKIVAVAKMGVRVLPPQDASKIQPTALNALINETGARSRTPTDKKQTGAACINNVYALLPQDAREIETAAQYACDRTAQLKLVSGNIDRSGWLKLFWDAKVPRKNKRFWYFFTWKSSDKEEVKAEIKKYVDFYEEMGAVAQKIYGYKGEKDEETYSLTVELLNNSRSLYRAAEVGIQTTNSSTVYELHRQMILKHERLEMMIKRLECVALKQSAKKANDGLQQALTAIDRLVMKLDESDTRCNNICDQFERHLTLNQEMKEAQEDLEAENEGLLQENRSLREDRRKNEQQLLLLEQQNEVLRQQRQTTLQENVELKQLQEVINEVLKSIAKQNKENEKS